MLEFVRIRLVLIGENAVLIPNYFSRFNFKRWLGACTAVKSMVCNLAAALGLSLSPLPLKLGKFPHILPRPHRMDRWRHLLSFFVPACAVSSAWLHHLMVPDFAQLQ